MEAYNTYENNIIFGGRVVSMTFIGGKMDKFIKFIFMD